MIWSSRWGQVKLSQFIHFQYRPTQPRITNYWLTGCIIFTAWTWSKWRWWWWWWYRCWCNLHGKECAMNDGRLACVCQHNTAGDSCEKCLPLYNNRQWQPGSFLPYPSGTANECQSTLVSFVVIILNVRQTLSPDEKNIWCCNLNGTQNVFIIIINIIIINEFHGDTSLETKLQDRRKLY